MITPSPSPPTIDDLFPECFKLALNDENRAKTFHSIELVCKKWRAILHAYFHINYCLLDSSPYPIPNILPKSAEFFKKLGNNKLVYAFPAGYYIYFLETNSYAEIAFNTASLGANDFVNIHNLGADCVVINQQFSSKIYRFYPETGTYKKETIQLWVQKTTKDFNIDPSYSINATFIEEETETIYLFLKGDDEMLSLLKFQGETLSLFSTKIPDTTILGIKNNKVFLKYFNEIHIMELDTDSVQAIVFNDPGYKSSRDELVYPYIVNELTPSNPNNNPLVCVLNVENPASIQYIRLNLECPDQTKQTPLSQRKGEWVVCNDCIVLANPNSFVIYKPNLGIAQVIPYAKVYRNQKISSQVMGSRRVNYLKSGVSFSGFRNWQKKRTVKKIYSCSPAVLKDAEEIQTLLENSQMGKKV